VYTEGWDRQVKFIKQEGKQLKQQINGVDLPAGCRTRGGAGGSRPVDSRRCIRQKDM